MIPAILDVVAPMRARADEIRQYFIPAGIAWDEAAAMVEEQITRLLQEPLELSAAALESGYTVGHLRRLLGLEPAYPAAIPNAGTSDEPRIRRCHLPRKPGHGIVEPLESAAPSSGAEGPASRAPQGGAATLAPPVAQPAQAVRSSRTQVARAVAAGS